MGGGRKRENGQRAKETKGASPAQPKEKKVIEESLSLLLFCYELFRSSSSFFFYLKIFSYPVVRGPVSPGTRQRVRETLWH